MGPAPTLDDVQAAVTAEGTVIDGAITLLGRLSDKIRAGANDPAKMIALADSIDQQKTKLADAVVANTPTTPPAPATARKP